MSYKPSARELRSDHALERAMAARLDRVREHEEEIRRMSEARWQRRILPLLSNECPVEMDWRGCFG